MVEIGRLVSPLASTQNLTGFGAEKESRYLPRYRSENARLGRKLSLDVTEKPTPTHETFYPITTADRLACFLRRIQRSQNGPHPFRHV